MAITAGDVFNIWQERNYLGLTLEAAEQGAPITAYMAGPVPNCPTQVTSWLGTPVGSVVRFSRTAPRWQGARWLPPMFAVQVIIAGRRYHGRGQGPGMYVNLRAVKVAES